MTTLVLGETSLSRRVASMPDLPGILMSMSATSGLLSAASAIASAASSASPAMVKSCSCSKSRNPCLNS
ncbi:MAG: hypothetical protein K0S78_4433 [Thermomicrobiales bacterium]|nr:hypothetical protein [Thermomicrobiales bacterium]